MFSTLFFYKKRFSCLRNATKLPPVKSVLSSPLCFQRLNTSVSLGLGSLPPPAPPQLDVDNTISRPPSWIVTFTQTVSPSSRRRLICWLIQCSSALARSFSASPIRIFIMSTPLQLNRYNKKGPSAAILRLLAVDSPPSTKLSRLHMLCQFYFFVIVSLPVSPLITTPPRSRVIKRDPAVKKNSQGA